MLASFVLDGQCRTVSAAWGGYVSDEATAFVAVAVASTADLNLLGLAELCCLLSGCTQTDSHALKHKHARAHLMRTGVAMVPSLL